MALGSISLQPASLILAYKQGRGRQEWMDWQNGFEATLAAMDHWSAVIDLTVWMKKSKILPPLGSRLIARLTGPVLIRKGER